LSPEADYSIDDAETTVLDLKKVIFDGMNQSSTATFESVKDVMYLNAVYPPQDATSQSTEVRLDNDQVLKDMATNNLLLRIAEQGRAAMGLRFTLPINLLQIHGDGYILFTVLPSHDILHLRKKLHEHVKNSALSVSDELLETILDASVYIYADNERVADDVTADQLINKDVVAIFNPGQFPGTSMPHPATGYVIPGEEAKPDAGAGAAEPDVPEGDPISKMTSTIEQLQGEIGEYGHALGRARVQLDNCERDKAGLESEKARLGQEKDRLAQLVRTMEVELTALQQYKESAQQAFELLQRAEDRE
jgi:hypothetical protein